MKVILTGYADGKKIHAIKGLRAATGLGLKESKDIIDGLDSGEQEISVGTRTNLVHLDELGVAYRVVPQSVEARDLLECLRHFPGGLTVAELRAMLEATIELFIDVNPAR